MAVNFNPQSVVAKVRAAAMAGVVDGAEAVREEAIRTMIHDPKTGRIYTRNGKAHQASAPGESPARETGFLINTIDTRYDVENLRGTVNAGSAYAAADEFGTAKMEPRPFMRPSLAKKAREIEADIRRRVADALK